MALSFYPCSLLSMCHCLLSCLFYSKWFKFVCARLIVRGHHRLNGKLGIKVSRFCFLDACGFSIWKQVFELLLLFQKMQASVQFRLNSRDLGMVVSAIDEDLAVFLETQRGEMGRNDHSLALKSDEFDESSGASPDAGRPASDRLRSEKIHGTAENSFLKLETERVGCDWLSKELDTSPLPLVKESMQDSVATQAKNSNGEVIFLKSELANFPVESASLCKKSVPLATSTGVNSSHTAKRIPLSSGGRKATRRSATPTGRTSLPAKSKSTHPSTNTLRVTKPVAAQGRSVPASRLASISSMPSTRFATPTQEPSTLAMASSASAKDQFSSGRKTDPVISHRKTKSSKPSGMCTSSHDTPQNSKTSRPIRAASTSQGGPSVPYTILLNAKSRQKAFSPSRERAPSRTHHKNESMMLIRNRCSHSNGLDEVNPVLLGSKMVERVVNMRKLAPPKQAAYSSQDYPQKNIREGSGFGRSLSKKSLDMAIRHMDIRRSIPDNIRPRPSATGDITTLLGTKSCSSKNSSGDVAESPLASNRY